ncbi:2,3-bisphosphoglycerate-independent phosphoglycerate mutase [bioreactor metagenome]|uniref:2,3-bisphosphoglycerate-independent phosphoglycerate mutase n=2 Tax=root TaxID=1 RepID=A0A645HL54_9ZZZZ
MMDFSTGGAFTSHTTNHVPFMYISGDANSKSFIEGGVLADIAPTMLTEMGISIPKEMTGKVLFNLENN